MLQAGHFWAQEGKNELISTFSPAGFSLLILQTIHLLALNITSVDRTCPILTIYYVILRTFASNYGLSMSDWRNVY